MPDKKFEYKPIIVNINIYLFDLLKCTIWLRSFAPHFYTIHRITFLFRIGRTTKTRHYILAIRWWQMKWNICVTVIVGMCQFKLFKCKPRLNSYLWVYYTSIFSIDFISFWTLLEIFEEWLILLILNFSPHPWSKDWRPRRR